jgi:transcriptional regulator with XRE-family HTH domain
MDIEVRAARKSLGLDQCELANMLGVSTQTVSNWERGQRPSPKSGEKLKRFLETNRMEDGFSDANRLAAIKKELSEIMIKAEMTVLTMNGIIANLKKYL